MPKLKYRGHGVGRGKGLGSINNCMMAQERLVLLDKPDEDCPCLASPLPVYSTAIEMLETP